MIESAPNVNARGFPLVLVAPGTNVAELGVVAVNVSKLANCVPFWETKKPLFCRRCLAW